MKKKIALLIFTIAASLTQSVFAADINVYLNDNEVEFPNAQPQILEGRTLVPLRSVFDAMGYGIEWDGEEKKAYLTKDDIVIETSEKAIILKIDGISQEIECDVLPKIIDGYFMLPLRAVSEAAGVGVEWDGDSRSVFIKNEIDIKPQKYEEENFEGTMQVSEKEYLDMLKKDTDYVYKFAVEKSDKVLTGILFEYGNTEMEGTITAPEGYYDSIQEVIDELKSVEPPESMVNVQDRVLNYLDILQKVVNEVYKGTYTATDIENDKKLLTENEQEFASYLLKYFNENKVNYERIYGIEILDALKRN